MDILQSILLRKASKGGHISKDELKVKPKYKRRSESLQAIFRLPKSVLDKYRGLSETAPLKRERSHKYYVQHTIQLGDIGQEYHHNLRRTILNQTKEASNTIKTLKVKHHQNNFMIYDQGNLMRPIPNRDEGVEGFTSQYEKNLKTLSILQKTIIKEDNLFQVSQSILELQANRLPIIRKKDNKRRRMLQNLEEKQLEMRPLRREASIQREHKIEPGHFSTLEKYKAIREEKPQIRGWDIPQYGQI